MNKTDLIQFVKEQTSFSTSDSEKAVNAVFEGISHALSRKEDAIFVGFGSFATVHREARTGRNPRTGEELKIPASNQVKFKAGKTLKEKVA